MGRLRALAAGLHRCPTGWRMCEDLRKVRATPPNKVEKTIFFFLLGKVSKENGNAFRKYEAFARNSPKGLEWASDLQSWSMNEKLLKLGPRNLKKHPLVWNQLLAFLGLMVRDSVPIFVMDPMQVFGIASDGNLVTIPHSQLKFSNDGGFINYKELCRPLRLLRDSNATFEYSTLVINLLTLLDQPMSVGVNVRLVRSLLESSGFMPAKRPRVRELDLCSANTMGELLQTLADHPDYHHMVQGKDGEIPEELELSVDVDGPIAMAFYRISNAEELEGIFQEERNHQELMLEPISPVKIPLIDQCPEMEIVCIERRTFKRGRITHEFLSI